MALTKLARPLFSTTHHTPLVKAKLEWRENGCDLEKAIRLVDSIYRLEPYSSLRDKPNAFLVVASTSGRNVLPVILAERLKRDYGGEVLEDFTETLARKESKAKVHWLDKMRDPVSVNLTRDLRGELAGRNVVLVDDILTTGESLVALRTALEAQGVRRATDAVLAAKKGGHAASPPNYDTLAVCLAKATGSPLAEVAENLQLAFPRVYANFLLSAYRDAHDHPASVYAIVRRQADLVRGNAGSR